jgi:dolichol-phosphate mannosyltransferase
MQNTLVSIISPVFSEGINILNFLKQVENVMAQLGVEYEIILVDDGSPDDTWRYIEKAARDNSKIIAVKLSANFGKEAAIYAGLQSARGGMFITAYSDLSHPIEMIGSMLAVLTDNKADIVEAVMVPLRYKGFYGFCVKTFYKLFKIFTGVDLSSATDFKVFNKAVLNKIKSEAEKPCYLGLSSWTSLRSFTMPFIPNQKKVDLTWRLFTRKFYAGIRLIALHSAKKLKTVCNIFMLLTLLALAALFKSSSFTALSLFLGILATLAFIAAVLVKRFVYKIDARPRYEISEIFYATKNIGK